MGESGGSQVDQGPEKRRNAAHFAIHVRAASMSWTDRLAMPAVLAALLPNSSCRSSVMLAPAHNTDTHMTCRGRPGLRCLTLNLFYLRSAVWRPLLAMTSCWQQTWSILSKYFESKSTNLELIASPFRSLLLRIRFCQNCNVLRSHARHHLSVCTVRLEDMAPRWHFICTRDLRAVHTIHV